MALVLHSQLVTETEAISPTTTDYQTITWTNPLDTILDTMHLTYSEPYEKYIRRRTLRIRRGTKHHDNEISFSITAFNVRILGGLGPQKSTNLARTNTYSHSSTYSHTDMNDLVRFCVSNRSTLLSLTKRIADADTVTLSHTLVGTKCWEGQQTLHHWFPYTYN